MGLHTVGCTVAHPGCGGGGGGTSSGLIAAALVGLTGSLPSSDTGLRVSGTGSPFAAGEKACPPAYASSRRIMLGAHAGETVNKAAAQWSVNGGRVIGASPWAAAHPGD
jgi:hypothetical protein